MAIGYACLTIGVLDSKLSACSLKSASEEKLRTIILANLDALESMINYNKKHQIKLFRISSDIIPFGSHEVNQIRWWEDYQEKLKHLGSLIMASGLRVTMHPGQYTVLNSPDPMIVKRAIEDLIYHDRFLSALGTDAKSKIILHIGGVYQDKPLAMERFVQNYQLLPDTIKERLILENDDKNYNIAEVLNISKQTGAPVVFDNLHHRINPPDECISVSEWIRLCSKTWKDRDGRQKLHYSQQKEGATPGSHSDFIHLAEFLAYYHSIPNQNLDIMLEVKDKNISAIKCILGTLTGTRITELVEEWTKYQCYVMSKSLQLYQEIQELLNGKDGNVVNRFYEIIEQAIRLSEDTTTQIYALEHVWNYIKNDATQTEKNRYEKLMNAYQSGEAVLITLKKHILKCAQVRNHTYLLQSLYFYL